ncbi:MAG: hypothetical protein U0M21_10610 [Emergencia sp.]|nr:hypothetical protein [Emergencia sp.]
MQKSGIDKINIAFYNLMGMRILPLPCPPDSVTKIVNDIECIFEGGMHMNRKIFFNVIKKLFPEELRLKLPPFVEMSFTVAKNNMKTYLYKDLAGTNLSWLF